MGRDMVLLDPSVIARPEIIQLVADGYSRTALVHISSVVYVTQFTTSGRLPRNSLKFIHGRPSDAQRLVGSRLWDETDTGWFVREWAHNMLNRPRVEIPKRTRAAVFERDHFACLQCGSTDRLSIDHIVAWTNGGTNEISNLQTLCVPCNSKKKDR